jgi:hypothetical protein
MLFLVDCERFQYADRFNLLICERVLIWEIYIHAHSAPVLKPGIYLSRCNLFRVDASEHSTHKFALELCWSTAGNSFFARA